MLRWLFSKLQQRELNNYLQKLRGMDGDEIGGVVALAAHMRNRFLEDKGIDFLDPFSATIADPFCVATLSRTAKYFQKKGIVGQINAAAVILWVHTLRATMNPDLRMKVREMWGELSRGFPYLEYGARLLEKMTGDTLDLRDAGTYPDGFTPRPI